MVDEDYEFRAYVIASVDRDPGFSAAERSGIAGGGRTATVFDLSLTALALALGCWAVVGHGPIEAPPPLPLTLSQMDDKSPDVLPRFREPPITRAEATTGVLHPSFIRNRRS